MNINDGFKGKIVMVTGGGGFIGSHLTRKLLELGAAKIYVVDSFRYGDIANLNFINGPSEEKIKIIKCTLGDQRIDELESAMKDVSYVFHLAAEKHNQSKDDPKNVLIANVIGTNYLFELASKNNVQKIVFTSSLYAYGKMNGEPFSESDVPAPNTIYGVSKHTGEGLLNYYSKHSRIKGDTIRFFFVYGPKQFAGMGYKSVILKNFERIKDDQSPVINGDGKQALDYIYVDDAVEATLTVMLAETSGEVFNVGTGRATNINLLTQVMLGVSGKDLKPKYTEADWTAGSSRVGNVDKIKNVLGWQAKTSLEDGIRQTWSWFKGECK